MPDFWARDMPVYFPAIPGPNEVHIWHVDLAGADESILADVPADMFTPVEIRRAERFAFDLHRNRFVRGRCALRRILGRYLGMDAVAVPIALGHYGKPYLDSITTLSFNLAHAEDFALLAVSGGAEIGIDIEKIRLPNDIRVLAQSVFSAAENAQFIALADDALTIPFFTCWTKKEAFLKALGTGLSLEAKSVHVGLDLSDVTIALPPGFGEDLMRVSTIALDERSISSLAVAGGYQVLLNFDYNEMI